MSLIHPKGLRTFKLIVQLNIPMNNPSTPQRGNATALVNSGTEDTRAACEAIWRGRKLDREADVILASVKLWKASEQWQEGNGQYVPHPSIFLME